MGIVLFILIFCIVVVVHELGHFALAKMNGIHVVEFSIGMGPTILHFDRNQTTYSLKLLPIGGACMFEGEDGISNEQDQEHEQIIENNYEDTKSGSFQDASVFARIQTVIAGPIFNFILAFIFSIIIIGSIGTDLPIVGVIAEGGAAEQAGMQVGDEILKIGNEKINIFREVSIAAMLNDGEPVEILVERDNSEIVLNLQPIYSEENGRYFYGIGPQSGYTKLSPLQTIQYSAYEVKYWIKTTFKSLGMLFTGKAGIQDMSGPVGMADVVDDIYVQSKDDGAYYVWINMLNFAILLSANLGVLNLIPFPALDGGRLFFLILEAIRRKPIPPEKEGVVHFVGFALLMLLMVVVMYNDIVKLFAR